MTYVVRASVSGTEECTSTVKKGEGDRIRTLVLLIPQIDEWLLGSTKGLLLLLLAIGHVGQNWRGGCRPRKTRRGMPQYLAATVLTESTLVDTNGWP